jgi:hypothetical protein
MQFMLIYYPRQRRCSSCLRLNREQRWWRYCPRYQPINQFLVIHRRLASRRTRSQSGSDQTEAAAEEPDAGYCHCK